jgi:pyroglutamyl-peptidase
MTRERKNLRLVSIQLPVAFGLASKRLSDFLDEREWDGLLMFGQAEKRSRISLEMTARNIMDPRIPDNEGQSPHGEIIMGGMGELKEKWGFEPLFSSLSGESWILSEDAGEYVCNELFYRQLAEKKHGDRPVGFVHLPLVTPQPGAAFELQEAVSLIQQLIEKLGSRSWPPR